MSEESKELLGAISRSGRQHLQHSGECEECLTETDMSELNLATGLCSACTKFDSKKMRELFERALKFTRENFDV